MKTWRSSLTATMEHERERTSHKKPCGYMIFARDAKKWIPARVKKRYGEAVYDVLTEDNQLWRRHANQMRSGRMERRRDPVSTTRLEEGQMDNGMNIAEHQATSTTSLIPIRSSRHRRPPERLQVDPHFGMYRCSS